MHRTIDRIVFYRTVIWLAFQMNRLTVFSWLSVFVIISDPNNCPGFIPFFQLIFCSFCFHHNRNSSRITIFQHHLDVREITPAAARLAVSIFKRTRNRRVHFFCFSIMSYFICIKNFLEIFFYLFFYAWHIFASFFVFLHVICREFQKPLFFCGFFRSRLICKTKRKVIRQKKKPAAKATGIYLTMWSFSYILAV